MTRKPATKTSTKTATKAATEPATRPAAKAPTAKSLKPAMPEPAVEPAPKPKHKLVRDSFTIPKAEYAVLDALKVRAANLARPVKKSELLRAGISALNGMSDKAFLAAMNGVPPLKTGRPSAAKAAVPAAKGAK